MISFFKNIFKKINKLDDYTKSYMKFANNIDFPAFAYTNWGLYLAELKDYNAATEKLETAMMMNINSPKPCISLGIIYAKQKEYDKAVEVLNEALRRDETSTYAYTVLSGIYVASDNLIKAQETIKKALKLSPHDSEVYLNYGILCAKMQKKIKAAAMFRKSKMYDHTNIHAAFLLAVMLFETDKTKEALSEFLKIEKINPKYKKLNYYIALCFEREKNYSEAEQYALKAIEEDSANPDIYILLAHVYYNFSNKQKVYEIFQAGNEQGINDFDFFISGATVFTIYNDIEQAKEYLKKALVISPNNPNALYRMGVCHKKENNLEDAIKCFSAAISQDEKNSSAIADLGIVQYELKYYEQALSNLFKALDISNDRTDLYFYIANCYYKLGKFKKSIKYYEKLLEYHGEYVETLINITVCYIKIGDYQEALRKIRSAYRIDRTSQKVIILYALCDIMCGIYSDAIEKSDIILKEQDFEKALVLKIYALIGLKKLKDATELLEKLQEKNSEIFVILSYFAYKTLVEENPSDYNKGMLNMYSEKIKSIGSEILDKDKLISYIINN